MPKQIENGFVTEHNFACNMLLNCLQVLEEHQSKINTANSFDLVCYTLQRLIPVRRSHNFVHYRLWNA